MSGVGKAAVPLPRRYGKYELLERIGEGGMAEVFRARLPGAAGFEKIVVIKRILPHFANNPHFVRMFVNEAKLAARIQHQNVVQVFELGQADGGELFMALEHVQGLDLRAALELAAERVLRLPVWFTVHVIGQVLGGLSFAHELSDAAGRPLGVVHRDVTPSNVFISLMGEVKIADFGVAKAMKVLEPGRGDTGAGQLKGKVSYMPPEQIHGDTIDARADLFSAGIVLWECLTQRRLFGGRADFETMLAICEEPRTPPSRFNPAVPPELDAITLRALQADRNHRFASAREFHASLLEVMTRLRPTLLPSDVRHVVEVLIGKRPADPVLGADLPGVFSTSEDGSSTDLLRRAPRMPSSVSEPPVPRRWADDGDDVWMPEPPRSLVDDLQLPPVPVLFQEAQRTSRTPPPRSRSTEVLLQSPELPSWEPEAPESWPGSGPHYGPHAFFLRTPENGVRGPLEYRVFLELCEESRGRPAEVSADGQTWLQLPAFARLAGLDYLAPEQQRLKQVTAVGALEQRSLVSVLSALALHQATGRLMVMSNAIRRSIDVSRGAPTFVYSERGDLQLPVLASRRDLFGRERIAEMVHETLVLQLPLEDVIRKKTGASMSRHRALLMRDRLTEIFRWRQGKFAFDVAAEDVRTTPFAATLLQPLHDLVQRCFTEQELLQLLDSRLNSRFEHGPLFETILAGLELSKPLETTARRIAEGKQLAPLLKKTPQQAHPHLALAYVLLETEAIRTRG